ncbi:hypothetical protein G7054_g8693 [Neopestalotiopsis clavispora]|nr:hypothetical protein G7054_g8693 [Neopestalotiopsis clavispora]
MSTKPSLESVLQSLRQGLSFIHLLWEFIESDFLTFAVPNTAFGIFGAFAPALLMDEASSSTFTIKLAMQRLPLVLAYNVGNLLVFDLANQRSPASVVEDRINKSWRPIPQGKITTDQTRLLMLVVIPSVLLVNYILGAWQHGVFILVLTWMYNDLQGGDEPFLREVIIAIAYGLFNAGSLLIAVGPGSSLGSLGRTWTAVVSGVILSTMQVQDLKDQKGDKTRGRKTIALFLGERVSRISTAFFVCFWSCVCAHLWDIGPLVCSFMAIIAATVALRVLLISTQQGDARTWRIWCFWHASLYALPVLSIL